MGGIVSAHLWEIGKPQPYLAKAAFTQHHQEVKVGKLHAILVAVGVEPGGGVARLAFGVLADFSSLDEESESGVSHEQRSTRLLKAGTHKHTRGEGCVG